MNDINYNFPVALQPIFLEGNKEITDRKAVVRTDTMQALGIVSNGYGLVRHNTVVDTFREAGKEFNVSEKIALGKNGGSLFYEMLFPKVEGEIQKNDIVRMRMIIKNSYNGLNSLQIIFGALRLVCLNGMVIGTKFLAFNYKHIGNVGGMNNENTLNLSKIKDSFKQYIGLFNNSIPIMSIMAENQLIPNDSLFDKEQVKLPQYLLEEARSQFENGRDQTSWGYYNALTYAITHKARKPNPNLLINYGTEAWRMAERTIN